MSDVTTSSQAAFQAPDPAAARARREFDALFRVAERHAATDERRRRHLHASVLDPVEVVRLVVTLASGGAVLDDDEPPVDDTDVAAALTLLPRVRADLDALELGLLTVARGRGLTWQVVAHHLGLGSAQAAKQRFERLTTRTEATAAAG